MFYQFSRYAFSSYGRKYISRSSFFVEFRLVGRSDPKQSLVIKQALLFFPPISMSSIDNSFLLGDSFQPTSDLEIYLNAEFFEDDPPPLTSSSSLASLSGPRFLLRFQVRQLMNLPSVRLHRPSPYVSKTSISLPSFY